MQDGPPPVVAAEEAEFRGTVARLSVKPGPDDGGRLGEPTVDDCQCRAAAATGGEPPPYSARVSPGESVQAAVDAAPDGASILLLPGVHELGRDHVELSANKGVHLHGEGAATLTGEDRNGSLIISHAGDASLCGISLVQRGRGVCRALLVLEGALTVRDCDLTSAGPNAVVKVTGGCPNFTQCRVHAGGYHGFYLSTAACRAVVTDCRVEDNHGEGIYVVDGAAPHLLRNLVRRNGGHGIRLEASASPDCVLDDNDTSDGTPDGNGEGGLDDARPAGEVARAAALRERETALRREGVVPLPSGWTCEFHGAGRHDCFLSYRVWCDGPRATAYPQANGMVQVGRGPSPSPSPSPPPPPPPFPGRFRLVLTPGERRFVLPRVIASPPLPSPSPSFLWPLQG